MIYLDNAATTFPKPECVYRQVDTIQRTIAVNVGRGGYRAASEAMKVVDETRKLLARLVGAQGPDQVILTPSATIAANEIINGLNWDEYKNVYVTPFEHNAIARPLHAKCVPLKIPIRQLPFESSSHALNVEEMKRAFALNPPDFLFLNQVSNVTGTVVPVEKIAEAARSYNADAVVVVDGSQSVGLVPVNLKHSKIDYLIFAGHKNIYASWGVGGFIYNSSYILKPSIAGGTGSDSLNLKMADSFPAGFEAGSPNIIAIASMKASLEWLQETTMETIANHKCQLMQRLVAGLKQCGVRLYLPSGDVEHTSVLSFNIPGYAPNEVGVILGEDFDIAVRTGYHCAPFIHDFLGTKDEHGTVRVSLGCFNTEADVDALISAVEELVEDLS
jgi:cysteine desulfurase family protein